MHLSSFTRVLSIRSSQDEVTRVGVLAVQGDPVRKREVLRGKKDRPTNSRTKEIKKHGIGEIGGSIRNRYEQERLMGQVDVSCQETDGDLLLLVAPQRSFLPPK